MPSKAQVDTLARLFWHNVSEFSRDPLLAAHVEGREISYSSADFKQAVLALARHFQRQGLMGGERVAILSENRPEWHIVDFAAHLAGLVVVPIYTTLSPAQMRYMLAHSGSMAIAFSSAGQRKLIAELRADLPDLRLVMAMDELGPIFSEPVTPAEEDEIRRQSSMLHQDAVATIIYTSGTTGEPKGVMLTHGNITFDMRSAIERLDVGELEQALSILPLSHVFERVFCYGHFFVGAAIAYGDPYDAINLLARYRPEVMACVPRILEKVHETVLKQIDAFPERKRELVRWLLRTGTEAIEFGLLGRQAKVSAKLVKPLADALLFRKIREKLGGRMHAIVSGGAPLNPETAEFFYAAGVPVIEGYGMTETSPVIAVNPRGLAKLGRVGPPIDGVEVKFAEDGELLTRGPHVMKGYYKNDDATAKAIRDGWLHTGDLGRFDEHGYIQITGRKKELIVTAYGKNVAHEPIEMALARSPLIRNAVLVGDRRRFISALIVPDREILLRVAESRGWTAPDFETLLEGPEVHALYQTEIDTLQQDFAEFERVKQFRFIPEDVMQDPEIVTPTMKLRRGNLERRFSAQIEAMYAEPPAEEAPAAGATSP